MNILRTFSLIALMSVSVAQISTAAVTSKGTKDAGLTTGEKKISPEAKGLIASITAMGYSVYEFAGNHYGKAVAIVAIGGIVYYIFDDATMEAVQEFVNEHPKLTAAVTAGIVAVGAAYYFGYLSTESVAEAVAK